MAKQDLLVECKHCQHRLDPNDDETNWAPPQNHKHSLGSIICPNCDNREDFVDWKSITDNAKKVEQVEE